MPAKGLETEGDERACREGRQPGFWHSPVIPQWGGAVAPREDYQALDRSRILKAVDDTRSGR